MIATKIHSGWTVDYHHDIFMFTAGDQRFLAMPGCSQNIFSQGSSDGQRDVNSLLLNFEPIYLLFFLLYEVLNHSDSSKLSHTFFTWSVSVAHLSATTSSLGSVTIFLQH